MDRLFIVTNTRGGSGKSALTRHLLIPALLERGLSPLLIRINCLSSMPPESSHIQSIELNSSSDLRKGRFLDTVAQDPLFDVYHSPTKALIFEFGSGSELANMGEQLIDHISMFAPVNILIPFTDYPPHVSGVETTLNRLASLWHSEWNSKVGIQGKFLDKMNVLPNGDENLREFYTQLTDKHPIGFLPAVPYSELISGVDDG